LHLSRRFRDGFGPDGSLRHWTLAVVVLLILVALVHPEAVLRGDIYRSSDATNAASFQVVGNQTLADGAYPQWNPYIFGGMPTFGSLSYTRFLYPPSEFLSRLQDDLGFPLQTWMLVHLFFGGLGMVWMLGRWDLPWSSRLLGAAVWLMLPKITAWAVHGHGSKLMTAMYLPWVVGLTLEVLRGRGRRAAGWLALLLGLQILSGHIQILYYTLLTIGLIVVARWIKVLTSRPRGALPVRQTVGVGLAIVLGLALGAILLLPVHDYAGWSIRGADGNGGGAGYDFATGWSLSPRELPTLVVAAYAGFGQATYQGFMPFNDYPNYLGLVPLLLAVAGLTIRERWLVRTLLALALLALLLSFGRFFPLLYEPCFKFLPYFNKFRIPSMVLILTGFGVAALAAAGSTRLDLLERARARWLVIALLGLGVVMMLGGLGVGQRWHDAHLLGMAAAAQRPTPSPTILGVAWDLQSADLVRSGLVLATAAAAALFALGRASFRTRGLVWVLLILTVIDLRAVDRRISHPETALKQVARTTAGATVLVDSPRMLQSGDRHADAMRPDPDMTQLTALLDHERAWPLGRDAGMNAGMIAGVRSLGGYHPAKLAAYETIRGLLYDRTQPAGRIANWLGGAVLVFDGRLPDSVFDGFSELGVELDRTPIIAGSRVFYRNRSALLRARLVTDWTMAQGDLMSFLEGVRTGHEPIADRVRLDAMPVPVPVPSTDPLPAVSFMVDGLNEVVLRASPPTPAILVLADMWMPGWTVSVDGEPAPLLVADHTLRAVALPAGEHEVRFAYGDPALKQGLTVTAAGGLLILLSLVFGAGFVEPRRRETDS